MVIVFFLVVMIMGRDEIASPAAKTQNWEDCGESSLKLLTTLFSYNDVVQ